MSKFGTGPFGRYKREADYDEEFWTLCLHDRRLFEIGFAVGVAGYSED